MHNYCWALATRIRPELQWEHEVELGFSSCPSLCHSLYIGKTNDIRWSRWGHISNDIFRRLFIFQRATFLLWTGTFENVKRHGQYALPHLISNISHTCESVYVHQMFALLFIEVYILFWLVVPVYIEYLANLLTKATN
jgi:hypothetical protein